MSPQIIEKLTLQHDLFHIEQIRRRRFSVFVFQKRLFCVQSHIITRHSINRAVSRYVIIIVIINIWNDVSLIFLLIQLFGLLFVVIYKKEFQIVLSRERSRQQIRIFEPCFHPFPYFIQGLSVRFAKFRHCLLIHFFCCRFCIFGFRRKKRFIITVNDTACQFFLRNTVLFYKECIHLIGMNNFFCVNRLVHFNQLAVIIQIPNIRITPIRFAL